MRLVADAAGEGGLETRICGMMVRGEIFGEGSLVSERGDCTEYWAANMENPLGRCAVAGVAGRELKIPGERAEAA